MDKEECIQALLSTLQKHPWKQSNSVTDWDLKNVLWNAGLLLQPEQATALLADVKRRGLITSRERRCDNRIVAMWGVRITPIGDDWLSHRAPVSAAHRSQPTAEPPARPDIPQPGRSPEEDALAEVGPGQT